MPSWSCMGIFSFYCVLIKTLAHRPNDNNLKLVWFLREFNFIHEKQSLSISFPEAFFLCPIPHLYSSTASAPQLLNTENVILEKRRTSLDQLYFELWFSQNQWEERGNSSAEIQNHLKIFSCSCKCTKTVKHKVSHIPNSPTCFVRDWLLSFAVLLN